MRISHGAPILMFTSWSRVSTLAPGSVRSVCARPTAEARQPGPSLTLDTAISYDQIHGKAAVLL